MEKTTSAACPESFHVQGNHDFYALTNEYACDVYCKAPVNPPSPPALSVKRRIGSLPSMTEPLGSDASGKARRASVTLDAVRINKVLGRDRSASRVDAATLRAFEETGTSLAQSPSALAPLNCDAENGGVDATVDTDFDVFAVLQLQRYRGVPLPRV